MVQYPEEVLHPVEAGMLKSRIIATMRKKRKYLCLWLVITGGKNIRRWIKLMELSLVKYVMVD